MILKLYNGSKSTQRNQMNKTVLTRNNMIDTLGLAMPDSAATLALNLGSTRYGNSTTLMNDTSNLLSPVSMEQTFSPSHMTLRMPKLKTFSKTNDSRSKRSFMPAQAIIPMHQTRSVRYQSQQRQQQNPGVKLSNKAEILLEKFRKRVVGAC